MKKKSFRGEVWTNIHPDILAYLSEINEEDVEGGVGHDKYSLEGIRLMQENFKDPIYATYTMNGTAANTIALKAMLDRYSSVITATQTHINVHECGAFEYNLGAKIFAAPSLDGKLTPKAITATLTEARSHSYLPKVIVLTQPTEYGVLYSTDEIKAITDLAHKNDMYVYMDGARICMALDALNIGFKELIEDTNVDAFTFGGTKAGALLGEMIVFRRKEFAAALDYILKQSLQHLDRSKFLGGQIEYLLRTGLWKETAHAANEKAKQLEAKLKEKGIEIAFPVDTNTVFCRMDEETLARACEVFDLHYWDAPQRIVRLCTTYLTTEDEIKELIDLI